MLNRSLLTTLLLALACAPAAAASPHAHSAAQQRAEASLQEAQQLLDGRGVRTGHELTLVLRELSTRLRHLRGDDRRQAVALLSRPTDADAPSDERYTVPEAAPLCDANFCIHRVDSTADAATPAQAALALVEANAARVFANVGLGWRDPPNDGNEQVDIYLKELGDQNLFGFASTDPGQDQQSQHSYLVIDDDFDPAQYGGADALESLRITLAHEYTHVLQYGYDVLADGWHYESSAVWMEQRMYPAIKDWLRFVNDGSRGGGWRSLTELPLTYWEPNQDSPGALDPRAAKVYGDAVWNHFLSAKYGAAGDALQRATWENSRGIDRPSTAAYDTAISDAGGPGISSDFGEFSAAVAEWRALDSPFPTAADLPDVERRSNLIVNGAGIATVMDHLTFALYDVPPAAGPIRLAASFPEGVSAAIALVARSGSIDGGSATTELLQLPNGGAGGVTIDDPAAIYDSGGRITAVLVNSDASHGQWSEDLGDWEWTRDDQLVTARVSSDTGGPTVTGLRPSRGATRVSTGRAVSATFSEPVSRRQTRTRSSCAGPAGARFAARSSTRAAHVPPRSRRRSRFPTRPTTRCISPARSSTRARTAWRRPIGPSPRCGAARVRRFAASGLGRATPTGSASAPYCVRTATWSAGGRAGCGPGPRAACASPAERRAPPSSSSRWPTPRGTRSAWRARSGWAR